MYEMRGITIDNGGSELRAKSTETGAAIIKLTNDLIKIEERSFRVKEVAEADAVVRIIAAPNEDVKGLYANGLTGKAYDGAEIRLNSQQPKTSSINYYRQILYTIARSAMADYKRKFKWLDVKRINNSKIDYVLVSCIPIREFNGVTDCPAKFKEQLAGEYKVEFPLIEGIPTISFKLTKENMGVVPEGGVAITSLRKELTKDTISLVIDMGHITTDIALFQGPTLLGKVISSPYAGSTLIANVRMTLADMGFSLTEEQTVRVIETGKVMRGATEVDVTETVNEQNVLFVRNFILKEIVQTLNMNAINASQVQNVIPIGAPMNVVTGMSRIQEEIIKVCGLQDAEIKLLADDLRYVNIEQAGMFTNRLFNKAVGKSC